MPKDARLAVSPKSRISFIPSLGERGHRPREPKEPKNAQGEPSSSLVPTTGTVRAGPSQGSFFESSDNVQNYGGQFSSTRGHHTNLTINFNQYANEDSSELAPSQNKASGSSSQQTLDTLHNDWPSPLPSRKSSEIYYRQLATKERGSPLWIPEPNNMLPVEYQIQGIGIGDVGIITDYGAFDYLFNICVPATDLINPEDMPEDFSPLNPPLRGTDVHGYSISKANSHLASAHVETFQQDGGSSGLTFESSASEGAILTMPRGSNSKDLRNLFKFRKYALANAENWYKYVNETRGREAKNGDVRLVVGCDSTTAWGMATFANLSENRCSRLRFKPIGENSLGRIYGWEYSGISMAEVKSGPGIHELEKLRNLDRAEDQVIYENQCLFVRTLNITLQKDVWNRLAEEWEMFYLGDESQMLDQGFHPPSATSHQGPFGYTGGVMGDRGGASDTCMKEDQETASHWQETIQSHTAHLSYLPTALDIHPSKLINEFLLNEKPNARVAITEDKDWVSVLERDDTLLPPPEILLDRIKAMYDVLEEEGMVFLQFKAEQMQTDNLEPFQADLGLRHNHNARDKNVDYGYQDEPPVVSGGATADQDCYPAPALASNSLHPSTLIPFTIPFFPGYPLGRTDNALGLIILSAPDAMRTFRRSFNWLGPSKLKKTGNYQIFKSGIPLWTYSMMDQGGKWILTLRAASARRSERSNWLGMTIVGEEVDRGMPGQPGLGHSKETQQTGKGKWVRVTSVGVIVVQKDGIYKLPWGSW